MGCTSSSENHASLPSSAEVAQREEFRRIGNSFETFEELQKALRTAGLESSSLILGVDYTGSNLTSGAKSFNGRSLHFVDPQNFVENPYQAVIRIVGRTLEAFDDDKHIPAFGFGDSTTGDRAAFPFYPDRSCKGFDEVQSNTFCFADTISSSLFPL